jgi:hypothetical protein
MIALGWSPLLCEKAISKSIVEKRMNESDKRKGSVQARVTRAANLESAYSGEPAPESGEAVFFSEKDIEEGTELVEAVSQSDLHEELKSSLG